MAGSLDADRLDPSLRRLIAVVLLGGIMGILDGSVVAVGVDTLATQLDASLGTIGWVSTGYLLALTIAIPVTTWAVDRFGARRLWLAALLAFLAASVASGLAWNAASLIAFRVLQGLAAGVLDPLVLVLLARAAGPRRAGRVMGLMGMVLSAGPVLGLIIGGLILEHASWRWMFLINLPIGVVALLGAVRVVPRDAARVEETPTRLDVVGVALLGPGFAAIVLALTQAAERGAVLAGQVLVPLVIAVALLAGYGLHASRLTTRRRTRPLIDPRLFTNSGFSASVAIMTLVGLATFATIFVLPLYYQQQQGRGTLAAGLLVAPFALAAVIAMPLSGRLSDRFGARVLVRGGAVVAALAELGFTRIGPQTSEVWPALAAFVLGAGLSFVGAPTMGSLYRTLPAAAVPQGSSVLYILNQLGAAIGVAVVTLILATVGNGGSDPMAGFHGVYWFAMGTLVVILAASVLLPGGEAGPTVAPPAAGEDSSAGAAVPTQQITEPVAVTKRAEM
ncbi:DHA2 family efflux MFS transporter permease subunit [Frankia sp. CNm7]|uniref:DHA2 family efflux MFS transporter permease subunit n=1 Tax=Frankia nepalensis TaxID=1836974 RepID=UPI001DF7CA1E|nr:DHA2 family efflux MFS transporter permease subunit [Frankia nepalensis]MBL7499012.1 DHA2 family efflux MFS transporter permease subunit [Frankia nepalensis]MBL7515826.1 DHA2 family efflux MFS transporter permease subunit [Frankia nepalensis]MBL7521411.1 DHA2 family efflux MFS transporter permease subunit [Frankia nepalensis]